jgi:hypothetical protein
MSAKSTLASRKQLLIAESELGRTQLVLEGQTIADNVGALAKRAKYMGLFVSAAASLAVRFASFRRKKLSDIRETHSR